jgi:1-acyl-sn-glycerol-3-phosphate acyltransferase
MKIRMRDALRRAVMIPVVVALAALFLAALPLVALCWLVSCIRLLRGRPVRGRGLRLVTFGTVYLLGECLCLLACLALWLADPRARDAERWQARHVAVLRALLGVLVKTAEAVFAFRLELESPRGEALGAGRPRIVLARHAGPGASFVLVHVLLREQGLVPRIVLKELLRLDPALDLLLSRIGCAFVGRDRGGDAGVAAITRLAAGLGPTDALVLFPEGGDWTPTRHRLAVRRLRLRGLLRQAEAAESMPYVLPPRPAGTFAALRAVPDADIAVFMHSGHDDLLDAESLWAALPLRRALHMVWWNEAHPEVSDVEDCAHWLTEVWRDIDAWIGEHADLMAATEVSGVRSWANLLHAPRTAAARRSRRRVPRAV